MHTYTIKMKTLICMSWQNCTSTIGIPKHAANIEMMVVDFTLENSFQPKPQFLSLCHQICQEIWNISVLSKRKDILSKVKDYINNHLNPAKVNFFDSSKDTSVNLKSVSKVLEETNITEEEYKSAL